MNAAGAIRRSAVRTASPSDADPDSLIDVEDLHVRFPGLGGEVHAVRGLSLRLHPGQMVGIVGESGSGKSVTARTLVGLTGAKARVEARRLAVGGRDVSALSERQWRHLRGAEIGFVLQDALTSLDPLRTVGREVGEPLRAHDVVPRARLPERVAALLTSVGIPDPTVRMRQHAHELSGGLRQRALIASALAADPSVIIADEPTTALDVTIQAQVMELFDSLKRAGKGVLLITHDLAVVAGFADYILVMRHGQVVEEGPARDVLTNPRSPYTRQLLAAVPSSATKGQRLFPGEGTGASSPPAEITARLRRPAADSRDAGPPLVAEVRRVSVRYGLPGGGHRLAVDDVSFGIPRGRTVGVVGESGSGKSTIARVVMGLHAPDEGDVLFDGEPWSAAAESVRRPARGRIQMISQDPLSSFDPQFSVERLIGQSLRLHTSLDRAARRDEAARLLALVGLGEDFLARRPPAMSGGQRQRVAIARALASAPELLVCDEAVSSLDVSTQAQVLDLLLELKETLNLSMVFISHDLGVVHHVSDLVVVMQDGRVVESGDVEEVFTRPTDPYTQRLLAAVPRLDGSPGR